MKRRLQRHRPSADIDTEIGGISLAVHNDISERAFISSCRRQNAANALQRTQISMAKLVVAAHRTLARLLRVERSEFSLRIDIADRLGIDQNCFALKRLIRPDLPHMKVFDVE